MRAVVLAGGAGTRLKPLTERRPKPLIPIAGRPCIDYVLHALTAAGIREIIVTTSYLSDRLIRRIGDGARYGGSIVYSFEEEPAGTAGAVRRLGDFVDGTFVVASGDVLADVDFRSLLDFHRQKGGVATMALTEVEDPSQFGVAQLDGDDRIVRFQEKPKREEAFSRLINAGLYVLEPEVLEVIPPREPFDFSKNVFPKLLSAGKSIYGWRTRGMWMDIGRPQDLLRANLEVVRREGKPLRAAGVSSEGPVVVGKRVKLEKGATLVGPCYVADGARVAAGATLRRACLYEGTTVGGGAVIEDSLILDHSTVGANAAVRNSIVSADCVLEDGVEVSFSVIGDGVVLKAQSKLERANIAPPAN